MDLNKKIKKKDYVVILAIPLAVFFYISGAVTFTSYVVMLTLSFLFGCLYTKVKLEWEDYQLLKNVQKTLIKIKDYEEVKAENEKLKKKLIELD